MKHIRRWLQTNNDGHITIIQKSISEDLKIKTMRHFFPRMQASPVYQGINEISSSIFGLYRTKRRW